MNDNDDRRDASRRAEDVFRAWVPIIVSLITTLLTLGTLYGKLGGRLDLIEYRLQQIELKVGRP